MSFKSNFIVLGELIGIIVSILIGLFFVSWLHSSNPKLLRIFLGIVLNILGAAVIFYGEIKMNVDVGRIGRIFFPSEKNTLFYSFRMKLLKWAIVFVCFTEGMNLLIQ